jgi:hypothetical protein
MESLHVSESGFLPGSLALTGNGAPALSKRAGETLAEGGDDQAKNSGQSGVNTEVLYALREELVAGPASP